MRKVLAVLIVLAVMLASAANLFVRGSAGSEATAGAIVRSTLANVDAVSFVLGLATGMAIMWVYHIRWGALPLAMLLWMRSWRRRFVLLSLAAAAGAVLAFY